MKKNGKQTALIIAVAVLAVALIGVTYAWLTQTLETKNTNVIKAGTFELTLGDSESEGITLEGDKATPVSDDTGKTYTPYSFTVTNTGTYKADYVVYLDEYNKYNNETIDFMDEAIVKYQLKTSDPYSTDTADNKTYKTKIDTINILTAGDSAISNGKDGYKSSRILGGGSLESKQSIDYALNLWIDSATTREQINGKAFVGKVRIEGTYQANSTGE